MFFDKEKELKYTAQRANEMGFFFRINGRNCKIMSYKGDAKKVCIPAYINGKPVRQIGTRAFSDKGIESIILPETLRVIKREAFAKNKIQNVKLPGNIEEVEDGAFSLCGGLNKVIIGKYTGPYLYRQIKITAKAFYGTAYISAGAFVMLDDILLKINTNFLSNSQVLVIPEGVREIKAEACGTTNNHINEISIPLSVKHIDDYAFAGLFFLQKIFIHKDTKYFTMGKAAFGRFSHSYMENQFIRSVREDMIRGNAYQFDGWIEFMQIGWITPWRSMFRCTSKIYSPKSRKEEFWELISIYQFWENKITLGIDMRGYFELYNNVKSIYDKIEMAVCILQNTSFREHTNLLEFLAEHINKAVSYAVKENNKERLMLYRTKKLLSSEKGFLPQKALKLANEYNNEAALYLKELLRE